MTERPKDETAFRTPPQTARTGPGRRWRRARCLAELALVLGLAAAAILFLPRAEAALTLLRAGDDPVAVADWHLAGRKAADYRTAFAEAIAAGDAGLAESLADLAREKGVDVGPDAGREIAAARAASSWEQLELTAEGARKRSASVQVDLGGIAKGYAIDRALESLRARGLAGGLVEVGGDLAVFGTAPDGRAWEIAVRDPRSEAVWGTLRLRAGAVCTSGDYARYVEIEGRRHSHIVDPRSGQPADRAASVTVVAPDATTADAWATALAVLGPEGLPLLPAPGTVEALLVFRDDDGRLHASATPGIARLVTPEDPGFVRLLAGEALLAGR